MIVLENLVKKFGRFTAVDHVSFSVEKGEIFGFLGANGAGKTTTIRMMCGLLSPTSGDIKIAGLSVGRKAEAVKKRIGYMSQRFSLYPDLTPSQNVDFFGSVYGVGVERLGLLKEELKEELETSDLNSMISAELPLGMKQRLGLFCALLHDPPLIFLDEPTSGVDPLGRRRFWDRIHELSRRGKTILVTTHFMDEAEYCGRAGIMNQGKLIELDSPEVLKQKYGVSAMNDVFMEAVK